MNNNRGFSLIELLIATAIILIAIEGFLLWTAETVRQRSVLSTANVAYNIAVDVSDRLSRLTETNVFLLPKSGNEKYVGYDANNNLRKCAGGAITANALQTDATGMSEFTNPWSGANLFLYDKNQTTFNANVALTATANANIDHPNSTSTSYITDINNIINPIRRADNGITYYVVWSVAYMSCATAPTDIVKIFITVYWIEPEPSDANVADVNTKLVSGAYRIKNVSITVDKALKAEQ